MERQVILLEDLIDVFAEELEHVLEAVDQLGPRGTPVYPADGMFLCWLLIYLGVADSQRRLIQLLAQHREWRERLGFEEQIPDQSTFSWFKNHRAKHVFERVFDEAVHRLVEAGVIRGEHLVVDASLFQPTATQGRRMSRESRLIQTLLGRRSSEVTGYSPLELDQIFWHWDRSRSGEENISWDEFQKLKKDTVAS